MREHIRKESGLGSFVDSRIDKSQERFKHPAILKAHPEALRVLRGATLDEKSFSDHYGIEAVNRDLRLVEESEKRMEIVGAEKAAEVLEAILQEHVELSNWLGPNAETIKTSRFDDIHNGVDMIVEINEEDNPQHLALGVDVTFGSQTMQKKFDRIVGEIHKDELAQVKYFRTHGYEGRLTHLPRIVVGVDIDKVIALAGLWDRKDNSALSKHITKDILAAEIERQLYVFLLYAKRLEKEAAQRSYSRAYNIFRKIRTTRNGFADASDRSKTEQMQNDMVYRAIMENLERIQNQ